VWVRETDGKATSPRAETAEARESIPVLFRDAVDSFVELVASHIKLTNLELVADLETRARQLGYRVAVFIVALLGYALLMVALALVVAPFLGLALAFAVLGGLHVAAAGIAGFILSRRHLHALQLERALHSMGKSMTVVADAVLGAPENSNARS
jgi:multidrug transporter EmrE-like cation transporter